MEEDIWPTSLNVTAESSSKFKLVTFNEVGEISSSIWKRIKVLLASLLLSLPKLWSSVKKASLPRSRF